MVGCDVSLTPQFRIVRLFFNSEGFNMIQPKTPTTNHGWLVGWPCVPWKNPGFGHLFFCPGGRGMCWQRWVGNGQKPGKRVMHIGIGEVFDTFWYIWFGEKALGYMFYPTTYGHEAPSNTKVNQTLTHLKPSGDFSFEICRSQLAELRSRILYIYIYMFTPPCHEIWQCKSSL